MSNLELSISEAASNVTEIIGASEIGGVTQDTWYLGVIFATLGCLAGSLGDNLVKMSEEKAKMIPESRRPPMYKRPLWVIGILSTVLLNTVFVLSALAFADAVCSTANCFQPQHLRDWSVFGTRGGHGSKYL